MLDKDLKSCINQWEHRKKLEKINLMIQKIDPPKKKNNELAIKSIQTYRYEIKKH